MLRNPWLPLAPTRRQARFLADFGRELLYGGAAGGGKSIALLMAAAQFVDVPGYNAILLRRSFSDLMQPEALIPVSKEWWTDRADWSAQNRRWTFPSGATITFGYLERDDDVYQYQGAAYQFIGFDELTQHTEFRYRYLFSRQRRKEGVNVPIRMRAASNPGGKGHEWVKRRFIRDGAKFVPAKLDDNPHLDQRDYVQALAELDPITRAQLLAGDWDAYEGGRFKGAWFREYCTQVGQGGKLRYHLQINKTREGTPVYDPVGVWAEHCWNVTVVDPAARAEDSNDYTVILTVAVTPRRDIIVLDVARERLPVEQIVPKLAEVCRERQPLWAGMEDVAFQLALIREAQRHPDIPAVQRLSPEGKGKLERATPAIIRAQEGQIYLPETAPWREDFVAELVQFTGDPALDAHDDQVDALAYVVQALDRHGSMSDTASTLPAPARPPLGPGSRSSRRGGLFGR